MIDFHTHLLPGIDDGSPDMAESEGLLKEEREQGTTVVVATPHFYASHVSVHDFLACREEAYQKVHAFADANDWVPEIRKAAEVYFFPGMGQAAQLPELTVEGTDILLLEMPFAQWTSAVYTEVENIIRRQHLTVMLVHLERFYKYQKDKGPWKAVLDLPVYVQLNTGSFLDWKKRHFDFKVLKSDLPVVLGSDCHNLAHRPPNMAAGREIIKKKFGQPMLDELDHTAERLLKEHVR